MANSYIHGAYGDIGKTQAQSAIQAGTTPLYIGTAPVNLVRGYATAGIINKPVKLSDINQATQAIGYAEAWDKYTLCEAVAAHLDNTLGNCAPVYVINVLDPAKHKKSSQTTATMTYTNGRAEIVSNTIILDSFAISDKAEGVDYSLAYDYATGKVIVTDLKGTGGSISATYSEVDPAAVTAEDIVGGITSDGAFSGIAAAELLYTQDNQVATLYAAPGWSHIPEVRNALVKACQKQNGHWMAYCFTDIPLESTATIQKAIDWKQQKGYNSQFETVCWPQVIDNNGRIFHLSTLSVWRQQLVDFSHNSVPFETASNKEIPGIRQFFGAGAKNDGYDKERGNELNEKGIRTACKDNGKLVLWGGHTAAYTYGATDDAAQVFDTNIRMLGYVINSFQREWGSRIDEPMTTQRKDEILNREQDKLDALVAQGALIGEPKIYFLGSKNSTTDMINGDFTFDHIMTPTPQLKSASATVSYSDSGFSVYTVED